MIVGGCEARWSRGDSAPSSAISSSLMISISWFSGVGLRSTSGVAARPRTALM